MAEAGDVKPGGLGKVWRDHGAAFEVVCRSCGYHKEIRYRDTITHAAQALRSEGWQVLRFDGVPSWTCRVCAQRAMMQGECA